MILRGGAFLCVWNDHDPDQAAEYEAWHTFEHVPERVCVPGFLAGRRYANYDRNEGRYFTLYDIATLDVLETSAYRDLQDNPTPWSQRMRLAFRNFERIPCIRLISAGEGCAGAIGTLVFTTPPGQQDAVAALKAHLARMLRHHDVTAYHLGMASSIPAYGVFGKPAVLDEQRETYVVIAEAVQAHHTAAALSQLADLVLKVFATSDVQRNESSDLLFQIHVEELAANDPRRRVPVELLPVSWTAG